MFFLHVVWRVIVLVRLGDSNCVNLSNLNNFLLWLVEWLVYPTWDGSHPGTQTTVKAAAQKSCNYYKNTSYDVEYNRICNALGLSATSAFDCAAIGTGTAAPVHIAIAIVVGCVLCVLVLALVVWIVIVAGTKTKWVHIIGGVRLCDVNWICVSFRRRVPVGVGLRRGVGWVCCRLHINSIFI